MTTPPKSAPSGPAAHALTADRVMLATAIGSAVAAVAIGSWFGDLQVAVPGAAVLLALAVALHAFARGTALSCAGLTACNVALVALHIQLGRGTIEFHFGVFVLLGVLLVYRDWRPLLLGAGLFAVHHIVFDRLQALDLGVYCSPHADLPRTVLHAVYVVAQTGVEIFLAGALGTAARETTQLSALVRRVDAGAALCLDVRSIAVTAPTAVLLKAVLVRMDETVSKVRTAAAAVEHAAAEIASANLDLSQRTEQQASSLQETAASMEQVVGAVHDTAQTAETARALSSRASVTAAAGGRSVDGIVDTMRDIVDGSRRMSEVIAVIDGIAFQTNILALNAAVEAARAGVHGRGFAAVAAEVRGLSHRSTTAASEVRALIGSSARSVESGTRRVNDAGSEIRSVVDQAGEVDRLIAQISGAARRQAAGLDQIGGAVLRLDAMTQQNAALVEQSAAASEHLKHQAAYLNDVVGCFVSVSAPDHSPRPERP